MTRTGNPIWCMALVALFVSLGVMLIDRATFDADVWWHLRTGQWVAEHRAVPRVDPFSWPERPWVAYHTLFQLLLNALYGLCGLGGIVVYTTAASLLIVAAQFAYLRRLQPNFAVAFGLTVLVAIALLRNFAPRPWLVTILFVLLELEAIRLARWHGSARGLWALPMLFWIWASVHVQFIYGLAVLAIAVLEGLLESLARRHLRVPGDERSVPVRVWAGVFVACALATLLNAYHVGVYKVIVTYGGQERLLEVISELHAMDYRDLGDWLVLCLALGAVFALGWRRQLYPFEVLLLLLAIFISFRARRDLWVIVLASASVLATPASQPDRSRFVFLTRGAGLLSTALVVALLAGYACWTLGADRLEREIEKRYPIRAVEFIEAAELPGPLYSHMDWGGYLIWALPRLPVSIDARTNVHGEERIVRSIATWSGRPGWETDPDLSAARLILAPRRLALVPSLRARPDLRAVYEDEQAVVFVRVDKNQ